MVTGEQLANAVGKRVVLFLGTEQTRIWYEGYLKSAHPYTSIDYPETFEVCIGDNYIEICPTDDNLELTILPERGNP